MAIGLECIVYEDSVTQDEKIPRLSFAVVPSRFVGSGVCSRSPIGIRWENHLLTNISLPPYSFRAKSEWY
eukprot:850088-Pyramimonas_sp.AAC.1